MSKTTVVILDRGFKPKDINQGLAACIRDFGGEIKVRFTYGKGEPFFDPNRRTLVGNYSQIQRLLKAAGLTPEPVKRREVDNTITAPKVSRTRAVRTRHMPIDVGLKEMEKDFYAGLTSGPNTMGE